MFDPDQESQQLPIDGVLDLHTFRPEDVGELVPAYLAECRARGILQVRIVHGKGIGNLKRSVHAILSRLPDAISFSEAGAHYGGSGATIVNLRALAPENSSERKSAPQRRTGADPERDS